MLSDEPAQRSSLLVPSTLLLSAVQHCLSWLSLLICSVFESPEQSLHRGLNAGPPLGVRFGPPENLVGERGDIILPGQQLADQGETGVPCDPAELA